MSSSQSSTVLRFIGPAFLVAIGYLDPGNWATDLEAGSRFGYELLWVVFWASAVAMLLQHLCVRLGVYGKVNLAEACRLHCPKWSVIPLYIFAEIAIIACDLADVIGTAIAGKLLLGIPLQIGVLLTVADVLLLMTGISDGKEYLLNYMMAAVLGTISIAFMIQMLIVKPNLNEIIKGFVKIDVLRADSKYWFAILGILGATVMPHNLYLHSHLVKEQTLKEDGQVVPRDKVKYLTIDLVIALTVAFLVNSAILIVSAATFHSGSSTKAVVPKSLEDAAVILKGMMGNLAFILFGSALLASGLSSTLTGTLAGQIVFEGFLKVNMVAWKRRLLTRSLAIIPALFIVYISGNEALQTLLLFSQIILSLQLPFAIIPLAVFAFNKSVLTDWEEDGEVDWCLRVLKFVSFSSVVVICLLNVATIVITFIQ